MIDGKEESFTVSNAWYHCKSPNLRDYIDEKIYRRKRIRTCDHGPIVEGRSSNENGIPYRRKLVNDQNSRKQYPKRVVDFVKDKFESSCIGTAFEFLGLISPLKQDRGKTRILSPHNDRDTDEDDGSISGKYIEVCQKYSLTKHTSFKEDGNTKHLEMLSTFPIEERERISRPRSINDDVLFSILEKAPGNSECNCVVTGNSGKQFYQNPKAKNGIMNNRELPTNNVRTKQKYIDNDFSLNENIDGLSSSLSSISCPSFSDDSAYSFDSSRKDDQESKAIDEMMDEGCATNSVDSLLSYKESFYNENVSTSSTVSCVRNNDRQADPNGCNIKGARQDEILLMLDNLSESKHESTSSFDSAFSFFSTGNSREDME